MYGTLISSLSVWTSIFFSEALGHDRRVATKHHAFVRCNVYVSRDILFWFNPYGVEGKTPFGTLYFGFSDMLRHVW